MQQEIERMITRQVERIIQKKLTAAVNQAVESKTKETAGQDSDQWRGNFHCVVSGYYKGICMKYLMPPLIIFMLLCALGSAVAGGILYSVLFGIIALVCLWCVWVTQKWMCMLVYWDGGMMIVDRKGNVLAQMPSIILRQAKITKGSIIIPWNDKEYKIVRDIRDNEQQIKEMLAFYEIE